MQAFLSNFIKYQKKLHRFAENEEIHLILFFKDSLPFNSNISNVEFAKY